MLWKAKMLRLVSIVFVGSESHVLFAVSTALRVFRGSANQSAHVDTSLCNTGYIHRCLLDYVSNFPLISPPLLFHSLSLDCFQHFLSYSLSFYLLYRLFCFHFLYLSLFLLVIIFLSLTNHRSLSNFEFPPSFFLFPSILPIPSLYIFLHFFHSHILKKSF